MIKIGIKKPCVIKPSQKNKVDEFSGFSYFRKKISFDTMGIYLKKMQLIYVVK